MLIFETMICTYGNYVSLYRIMFLSLLLRNRQIPYKWNHLESRLFWKHLWTFAIPNVLEWLLGRLVALQYLQRTRRPWNCLIKEPKERPQTEWGNGRGFELFWPVGDSVSNVMWLLSVSRKHSESLLKLQKKATKNFKLIWIIWYVVVISHSRNSHIVFSWSYLID